MSACRKVTDCYICLMLLLFPLFTGFRGYSALTNSKFYFLLAASLTWVISLIVIVLSKNINLRGLQLKSIDILFLGIFVLISVFSSLISPSFPRTLLGAGRWDGLVTTLLYAVIYLGIQCFGERKDHHLYCLGISTVICVAIALVQLLGKNPFHLFPGSLDYYDANIEYSGEFLGTIGNVDILAAFLCLGIPLFAYSFVGEKKNTLMLVPAAVGLFLLLESGVKSGLVGLAFSLIVSAPVLFTSKDKIIRLCQMAVAICVIVFISLLLHFDKNGLRCQISLSGISALICAAACLCLAFWLQKCNVLKARQVKQYRIIIILIILIIMISGLAYLWFYSGDAGTLYELSSVLHGNLHEEFGSSRVRIWRNTLELVEERPLIGSGVGSLADRLSIHFSRLVPETGKMLRSYVDNAHNIYLTILSDTGILGLLAYLGLLLSVLNRWINNQKDALNAALGCAVLAYSAEEFFGLGLCISAPIFWIILALCAIKTKSHPDVQGESLIQAG